MGELTSSHDARDPLWINPIGGIGDMLMVCGVLKQVMDLDSTRNFNLVRRSAYRGIFQDHPAIASIGSPPRGAQIVGTDYWAHPMDSDQNRPYQILARIFGLDTPVEEILYFPGDTRIDPIFDKTIPWKKKNIVLATGSDSPRKMMNPEHWDLLAKRLARYDFGIFQVGKLKEVHVKHSYSLLGLTSPGEMIALLRKADAVITIDTFAMHAAHLVGTPAVVLWGPTDPSIYGYSDQRHFRNSPLCEDIEQCIGPKSPRTYATSCPKGSDHCLDQISLKAVETAVLELLGEHRNYLPDDS